MRISVLMGAPALAMSLIACSGTVDGEEAVQNYAGIGADEVISLAGTEPFWSMTISGESLTYKTPENSAGTVTRVKRFAGNNGLGFSGTLEGRALQIAVTPGQCGDGMSDRTYPFTTTITFGDSLLEGCGYSSGNPYTGEESHHDK